MAKRKTNSGSSQGANKPQVEPAAEWNTALQISWWALVAMVFITPILVSNWTWLGFQVPFTFDQFDIVKVFAQRALTLVAFVAWAWDISMRGGKIRHTPVNWLILAFLAWVTLSTIFSIHPPTALLGKYRRFEGLLSFINYAVIFFLVMQLADRPSRIRQMLQAVFFAGIVVAGYGVLQSFGADPLQWGTLPFEKNRAFSTYGNPDLLGGFLMFSTFVSMGLALAESKVKWRAVYWMGVLINVWCIVVAFTRSAWVGSVVGIFFVVLFAIRHRVSWGRLDWGVSAAIASVAGVVIGRSLTNPNDVMNFGKRVASILEFSEGSALTRFQIWGAAWGAIKDRPILGFGPDTFRLLFPKYKPIEYVEAAGYLSVADNVHNYPLQLASGIGVPGALGFFGIAGWTAVRTWPVVFAPGKDANRMLLSGAWAACAAYLVHLFFGLSVTGASFLLWVMMALLLSPTATVHTVKRTSWSPALAAVAALLALVGIGHQATLLAADNAYLRARVLATGAERTALATRAYQLNPLNDIYMAEIGVASTDEFIEALTRNASLEEVQSHFARAEKAFRDTIAFVPPEYDNYVFLSNLYNIAGETIDDAYFDDAIEVGLAGVAVEPYGPAVRVQLARALAARSRYSEAEKHLLFAIKMDPAYDQPAVILSKVYMSQGKQAEAIELLQRYPGSEDVKFELDKILSEDASSSKQ